jgi:hypothetical protein
MRHYHMNSNRPLTSAESAIRNSGVQHSDHAQRLRLVRGQGAISAVMHCLLAQACRGHGHAYLTDMRRAAVDGLCRLAGDEREGFFGQGCPVLAGRWAEFQPFFHDPAWTRFEWLAAPASVSAGTRWRGSLTTSVSAGESAANILPRTLSAAEPEPAALLGDAGARQECPHHLGVALPGCRGRHGAGPVFSARLRRCAAPRCRGCG